MSKGHDRLAGRVDSGFVKRESLKTGTPSRRWNRHEIHRALGSSFSVRPFVARRAADFIPVQVLGDLFISVFLNSLQLTSPP